MTVWRKLNNCSFSYFDTREISSELFPFASLIEKWQSKLQGRRVPAWSDFEFFDFRGWHGQLAIYDVSFDPFDYKVRLSGVQFDQLMGRTMTNVTRDHMIEISKEDGVAEEFFEMCCRSMYFSLKTSIIKDRFESFKVSYLEMPLSEQGDKTTHVIEAFIISPQN